MNLTLVVFFLLMAVSMLVSGPLSDKYGRKPVLLCSMALFVLGSALCVIARGVWPLIAFRAVEAIGGGASIAVSIAVIKDSYTGRQKERALAIVSAIMALGPAVGPLLGSIILATASWRAIFALLAGVGLVALAGCWLMRETLQDRSTDSVLK